MSFGDARGGGGVFNPLNSHTVYIQHPAAAVLSMLDKDQLPLLASVILQHLH